MRRTEPLLLGLHAALLVGVVSGCGADTVQPTSVCRAVDTQGLLIGDTSPLGFSPLDVIGNVVNSYTATFEWADSMTSMGEVSLEYVDNTARFEEREQLGEPDPGQPPCEDAVALDMNVLVISGDDRLNDVFRVNGFASAATAMDLSIALPAQLNGTLNADEFAPGGSATKTSMVIRAEMASMTATVTGEADGDSFSIATVTGTVE